MIVLKWLKRVEWVVGFLVYHPRIYFESHIIPAYELLLFSANSIT